MVISTRVPTGEQANLMACDTLTGRDVLTQAAIRSDRARGPQIVTDLTMLKSRY